MAVQMPDRTLVFEDRTEAGRVLARELLRFANESPIVLALPRGGVVVAFEIARELHAPLDVIVARKVGAPGREELGIGAVAPGGVLVLDEQLAAWLGITEAQLRPLVARETDEMNRRLRLYRGDRPMPDLKDRTAILVDDGLATGVTARAAVQFLRQQRPQRIIVAIPVCSPDTAQRLQSEVDEVVCASYPYPFYGVGMWYREFDQTSDQEVIDLLARARNEFTMAEQNY